MDDYLSNHYGVDVMENLIGIDIGGTKSAVVLGRGDGQDVEIVSRVSFPTEASKGPENTIGRIFDAVGELISGCGRICGIGISCGGPLDSRRGVILSPPNLPGWDNVPIVMMCELKFGIRTKLQNDANACALAEWRWGAAKGFNNVVFLTFGTGMGAGLILDGMLYNGANGMAGEIGHIRLSEHGPVGYGKAGSFEGFCSGGGIAQLARAMALERMQMGEKVSFCRDIGELEALNAKAVGEAVDAGDELAREIFRACGRYLGCGLSILIDLLNPEIIVIGSIYTRREALLRDTAMKVINRETLTISRDACRIVPAGLGESIGDYAALAVALDGTKGRNI